MKIRNVFKPDRCMTAHIQVSPNELSRPLVTRLTDMSPAHAYTRNYHLPGTQGNSQHHSMLSQCNEVCLINLSKSQDEVQIGSQASRTHLSPFSFPIKIEEQFKDIKSKLSMQN